MATLLADESVSISAFKQNPAKVARDAAAKPLAVLSHNEPAFYVLSPEVFERMFDLLDDKLMEPLLLKRLARLDQGIEVSLDDL